MWREILKLGPAAALRDAAMRALGRRKMLPRCDWLYDAHNAAVVRNDRSGRVIVPKCFT